MSVGVERIPAGVRVPTAMPRLARVHQRFDRPRVADIPGAVRAELRRLDLGARVRPGARLAVSAGSRGIRDIVPILRAVVDALRAAAARPLLVAAMGSHSGGTEDGQRRLLQHLGITAEAIGAPLATAMEVVEWGRTPGGFVVYCDRHAAACDGIFAVNRIKPHTGFSHPFGSGLMKMLGVGLGKAPGAAQIHRQGPAQMASAIREIAESVIATGRVVGGLAILENGMLRQVGPPEDVFGHPSDAWVARFLGLRCSIRRLSSMPVQAASARECAGGRCSLRIIRTMCPPPVMCSCSARTGSRSA